MTDLGFYRHNPTTLNYIHDWRKSGYSRKEGSVYKKGVRKTGRKSVLARLQSDPTNYKPKSVIRPFNV